MAQILHIKDAYFELPEKCNDIQTSSIICQTSTVLMQKD
jgi:hypothetical protein